jgi:putative ABC transport system permease protein
MDALWQDLRHGLRLLLTNPGFTTVAVVTLALGIGANTAIFSAVAALLLRPLPVVDVDRLASGVALREGFDPFNTSLIEYAAYRHSPVLASSGIALQQAFTIAGSDEPERVQGASVSAGYLATLGTAPIAGRRIGPDDDEPAASPVAMIAYGLWQRRFGGRITAVGERLTLDHVVCTIVGIMPEGFDLPAKAEVWVPLRTNIDHVPAAQQDTHSYDMVGRLASSVTLAQADAELKRIARRLEDDYPQSRRGWTYRLVPLRQQLLADFGGRNRRALLTLETAVGFLLLICCTNVACLLLVRGVAREREMAVRLALGAARGRVVGQLLAESALLAIAGGMAGMLVAAWLMPVLAHLNPIRTGALTMFLNDFTIDGRVMAFSALVSLVTGALFGIVPALKAAHAGNAITALKQREQRMRSPSGRRWLGALVIVEIAMAVVLLVNGSFIVQSFAKLQRVDLGFSPENLLTLQITLPVQQAGAHTDRMAAVNRVVESVRTVPGVSHAGIATNIPLQSPSIDTSFTVEGRPPRNPSDVPITAHRVVTSDYLQTLGVRLVKGRLLDEHDRDGAEPVVVISEELARQAWPNADPIGKRLRRGRSTDDRSHPWMTVVGVVGDVKEDSFNFRIDRPVWYVPYAQLPAVNATVNLLVRTTGNPAAAASEVTSAVRSAGVRHTVAHLQTMTEHVSAILVTERFSAVVMTALASVGLFLAACGLYGVIAYSASQRTSEIGLRMVLGAGPREVLALVMRQGAAVVAVGLVVGLALARVLSVALAGTLYHVDPEDPTTFAVVAIVLASVSAAACFLPALRATRVEPLVALKAD